MDAGLNMSEYSDLERNDLVKLLKLFETEPKLSPTRIQRHLMWGYNRTMRTIEYGKHIKEIIQPHDRMVYFLAKSYIELKKGSIPEKITIRNYPDISEYEITIQFKNNRFQAIKVNPIKGKEDLVHMLHELAENIQSDEKLI